MSMLRHHILARIFTFITAVVFLNMSFFLAEAVMLDLHDRELIENVANLITNSGFEEERDGETSGNDFPEKGIDLLENRLVTHHHSSLYYTGTRAIQLFINHYPAANHAQTYTPPPEDNIFIV